MEFNATVLILCLAALAAAIILSVTRHVNIGLSCMTGAFLIGVLVSGDSVATVYNYWPNNFIFFLIASALFYGFARENGTLTLLGSKLLYLFRNHISLMPVALMLIAFILSFLGAGPGTIVLLAPIGYAMSAQINMNPLLIVFAIDCGYNIGSDNPFTGIGVALCGLIEEAQGAELAFQTYWHVWFMFILTKLLQFIIIYIIFRYFVKREGKSEEFDTSTLKVKPEAFNPIQKKTLVLIFLSFGLMVVPNILNAAGAVPPGFFKTFVGLCKPHAILIIFSLIACIMDLAPMKKVFTRVPIGVIMVVSGAAFLMEIARANGLNNLIMGFFENSSFPTFVLPPIFLLICAFLSLFSSGTSVVLPLIFPLIPAMSAATGLNPVTLYAASQLGALSTPISPFSTAGSQFLGLAAEEDQDYMLKGQIILALSMSVLGALMALVGLTGLWPI